MLTLQSDVSALANGRRSPIIPRMCLNCTFQLLLRKEMQHSHCFAAGSKAVSRLGNQQPALPQECTLSGPPVVAHAALRTCDLCAACEDSEICSKPVRPSITAAPWREAWQTNMTPAQPEGTAFPDRVSAGKLPPSSFGLMW